MTIGSLLSASVQYVLVLVTSRVLSSILKMVHPGYLNLISNLTDFASSLFSVGICIVFSSCNPTLELSDQAHRVLLGLVKVYSVVWSLLSFILGNKLEAR